LSSSHAPHGADGARGVNGVSGFREDRPRDGLLGSPAGSPRRRAGRERRPGIALGIMLSAQLMIILGRMEV
jgi:hypothetical protein